ncbi:MAG: pyruvate, water dikinase regulatory protein [bacterium]|nr:pyruvate, water dikinase regulatory protein [bacterium]
MSHDSEVGRGRPGSIFVVSDSIGETAELVTRAAASQFDSGRFPIRRFPYVSDTASLLEIINEARAGNVVIVYTLVEPRLRDTMREAAHTLGIPTADIMGPVMEAIARVTEMAPRLEPGLTRRLDEEYFRRVEAVEFAVNQDDGKNPRGLESADCVLLGISRVSKTPVCMYLARRGVKAANFPLIPEVELPPEIVSLPSSRLIGLTADAQYILDIRRQRAKVIGLRPGAPYAEMDRILKELEYADEVFRRLGCHVIDMTRMAIEETASRILEFLRKGENSV